MAKQNLYSTQQMKAKNYKIREIYSKNKALLKKNKELQKQLIENNDQLLKVSECTWNDKELETWYDKNQDEINAFEKVKELARNKVKQLEKK